MNARDQWSLMGGHREPGNQRTRDQPYIMSTEDNIAEGEVFDINQFCHADYGDTTSEPDAKPPAQDNAGNIPGRGTITTETWESAMISPRNQSHINSRGETKGQGVVPGAGVRCPKQGSEMSYLHNTPHNVASTSKSHPKQATPYYTHDVRGSSRYEPFKCHFVDSQRASAHRKESMRFGRKPYKAPETDESIKEIEQNRIYHVERIYNAMTSGDKAKDNDQSPAMKRWVHSAYYETELVESIAHKVLDCLLQQVKLGYRGWRHTDYVADDRKGEDEDRDVDCAGRLKNIICALEEEKTICEDVMQSASQIRMFVNAPKAYASRKHQNRLGNRKRGLGIVKETGDDNPRPAKTSRLTTRPRRGNTTSSTASGCQPFSTADSLQPSFSRNATPSSQPSKSPATHGLPLSMASPLIDNGMKAPLAYDYGVNASHLPTMAQSQQYDARMHSVPPTFNDQFLSPPVLSMGSRSAPVTPDDAIQIQHDPDSWMLQLPMNISNMYPQMPIDPPLFDSNRYWNTNDAMYSVTNANLFDEHPEAAVLDASPNAGNANVKAEFQPFWTSRSGVQRFPQGHSGNHGPQ